MNEGMNEGTRESMNEGMKVDIIQPLLWVLLLCLTARVPKLHIKSCEINVNKWVASRALTIHDKNLQL